MKTIVLTGGGTAGHVTPNMALIPHLQRDGYAVHYIGAHEGIERNLIQPLVGVTYHGISTGKLRRYFSLKNFSDPWRVLAGIGQTSALLKRIRPDVVFSKGGFVGVPVTYAAKLRRIPVVLHESDYSVGLANRLSLRHAKTVCVSFEPTLAHINAKRGVWTGSPIRSELLRGSAARAQALCAFADAQKPWILFMGGSLGSAAINAAVKGALDALCEKYNVVHLRGRGNLDPALAHPSYRQYEFVHGEMADLYAAGALVVCRSGANTLFELLALRKPALFIPLPRAQSRGDQILNARYFEDLGYAHVLMQEELDAQHLAHAVAKALVHAPAMAAAMATSPVVDGTAAVLKEIYAAAKTGGADVNA
jgi:UDP-N-acetylglucosamine--N-acetylmuramyl-(pentapeptide) pyrophosphoryl-undecaprenol N-acetylglucosamine transferase